MTGPKVLHIGIAPRDYVKKRTIEIARGHRLAPGEPRRWLSSLDALARLLSEKNLQLLELIRSAEPKSISELARLSGRAKSNLSRTLQSMQVLGLIEFRDLSGGRKVPTVAYDAVKVEYRLPQPAAKAA